MTDFHMPTAFQILGVITLVMPTVAWFALASRHTAATALWCGGGLLLGIASLLIGLVGRTPTWMTPTLTSLLLFLGHMMLIQSMRLDLAVPWRLPGMVAASSLFILVLEGIRLGMEDSLPRLQYVFSVWIVMTAYLSSLAWRIGQQEQNRNAYWIAGAFLIVASSHAYNLIAFSTGLSPPSGLVATPNRIFFMLAGVVTTVISNVAYVGLAFERSQRKAVEVETQYHAIIESSSDGFWVCDAEGRFLDVNRALCEMLGYRRDELLGMKVLDVEANETAKEIAAHARRVMELGSDRFETRYRCKDGHLLDIEISTIFLSAGEGKFVVFIRDIAERKRAEIALQQERAFSDLLIDASPDTVFLFEPSTGKPLRWNKRFSEISGYSDGEIGRLRAPDDFYNQDDLKTTRGFIEKALSDGTGVLTISLVTKSGSLIPYEYAVTVLKTTDGKTLLLSFGRDVTERKRAEEALRSSEELLREVGHIAKVGGWNLDLTTNTLTWAEETCRIHEVDPYFQPQLEDGINFYAADARPILKEAIERAVSQGVPFDLELPFITAKNNHLWVRSIGKTDRVDGQIVRLYGIFQDITDRKDTERQLRLTQFAVEQFADEVYIIRDDISFQFVNDTVCRTLEYDRDELMTMNILDIDPVFNNMAEALASWQAIKDAGSITLESLHRTRSGRVYPVEIHNNFIEYEGEGYVCSICHDITERKQAEEEITQLAFYDPLTQLPNRRLLLDRLQQALVASNRSKLYGALLFIDLDNFKALNDSLGHDKGDLLLQQVASRISAGVRKCDTVARFGGDEFVVMLTGVNGDFINAATQTQKIGGKILDRLNQAYDLAGYDHHCSASIGITLFFGHSISLDELLKQADIALYQAKAEGRNTLCLFDAQMQSSINHQVALVNDLRHALVKNQFRLYCQIEVADQEKVIGAEVLLRWQHPVRGLISPVEFIPLAEDTGLILPIGLWVLETACVLLKSWEKNPDLQALHLAINISAHQFRQPDFVESLLKIMQDTGINPDRLILEITESMVLGDIQHAIAKMTELKRIGVRFAMDDFGTGYSSLAYLTRLPFDHLKIDRSFVQNIGVKPTDAVIIQTIIAMANELGMIVVAEGVETEAQHAFLQQHGCPVFQGYLFGRPMPLAEFEDSLQVNVNLPR